MKKMLSLILGAALTVTSVIPSFAATDKSFSTVGSSGVFINEDFTKPEAEMNNDQWAPKGWTFQGVTDVEIERVNPEGYVELKQNFGLASAQIQYPITKTIPKKFTLMYDVYFGEDDGRYVYIPCVVNGYNLGMNASGSTSYVDAEGVNKGLSTGVPEFNTWYTYVFQVTGNRMSIYRRAENEDSFSKVADNVQMQTTTSANTIRIYATNTQRRNNEARFDNVKIVSGTYLMDSDVVINPEKTEIEGKLKIGNGDIPLDKTRNLTVIMSAYDSRGKIQKLMMNPLCEVAFGEENEISVKMAIDEDVYETLKGGTVELYVWDSASGAKPQCDMHVIEVQ